MKSSDFEHLARNLKNKIQNVLDNEQRVDFYSYIESYEITNTFKMCEASTITIRIITDKEEI